MPCHDQLNSMKFLDLPNRTRKGLAIYVVTYRSFDWRVDKSGSVTFW